MLRFLIFILLLQGAPYLFGQTDTIYYDRNWNVTTKSKAGYYRLLNEEKADEFWSFQDFYYPSGQLQNRGQLSQLEPEIREGEFIWFHANGEKEMFGHYEHGERVGKWVTQFENGSTKHVGNYVSNLRIGEWLWYYENGQLKSKGFYKEGQLEGERTWWYVNGNLMREIEYHEGAGHGEKVEYHENGTIKEKSTFNKDQFIGLRTTYYENGIKRSEINYESGVAVGDERWWDVDGEVTEKENVVDERDEHSLLWEITGNGLQEPSYLFGTMHVRDRRAFEFGDSMIVAFANCEAMSMEIHPQELYHYIFDIDPNDSPELKIGNELPGLTIDKYDQGKFFFDSYWRTNWLVDLNGLFHRGYGGGRNAMPYFVDAYLYAAADRSGMKTFGLEEVEAHIKAGENLPTYRKQFDILSRFNPNEEMILVYQGGNIKKINALMNFFTNKEFQYRLLIERNYLMADKIDSLVKEHSTFNTCGSAHLPGKEGVITLLENMGYSLRAVDPTYSGDSISLSEPKMIDSWRWFENPNGEYRIKLPGEAVRYSDLGVTKYVYSKLTHQVGFSTYTIDPRFDQNQWSIGLNTPVEILGITDADIIKESEINSGLTEVFHVSKEGYSYRSQIHVYEGHTTVVQMGAFDNDKLTGQDAEEFFASYELLGQKDQGDSWVVITDTVGALEAFVPEGFIKEIDIVSSQSNSWLDPYKMQRYFKSPKGSEPGFVIRHHNLNYEDLHSGSEKYFEEMEEALSLRYGIVESDSVIDLPQVNGRHWVFFPSFGNKVIADVMIRGTKSYLLLGFFQNGDLGCGDSSCFGKNINWTELQHQDFVVYSNEDANYKIKVPKQAKVKELEELVDEDDWSYLFDEGIIEEATEIVDEEWGKWQSGWSTEFFQSFKDSLSGMFYTIKRFEFSPYFHTEDLDSLKRTILNENVTINADTLSLTSEEFKWINHTQRLFAKRKVVDAGNQLVSLTVYGPEESQNHIQVEGFFESFELLREVEPQDFSLNKASQLLQDLSSQDSAVQTMASKVIWDYQFDSSHVSAIHRALLNESKNQNQDIQNNSSALLDQLLVLTDSTTLSVLKEVSKFEMTKHVRRKVYNVLLHQNDSASVAFFTELLLEDTLTVVNKRHDREALKKLMLKLTESPDALASNLPNFDLLLGKEVVRPIIVEMFVEVLKSDLSNAKLFWTDSIEHSFNSDVADYLSDELHEKRASRKLILDYLELLSHQSHVSDSLVLNNLSLLRQDANSEVAQSALVCTLSLHAYDTKELNRLIEESNDPYALLCALSLTEQEIPVIDKSLLGEYQLIHQSKFNNSRKRESEIDKVTFLKRKKINYNGQKVYIFAFQFYKQNWNSWTKYVGISGPIPVKEDWDYTSTVLGSDRKLERTEQVDSLIKEMILELGTEKIVEERFETYYDLD